MSANSRIAAAIEDSSATLLSRLLHEARIQRLDSNGYVVLHGGRRASLSIAHSSELSSLDREVLVTIFEANMMALYEASAQGYDRNEKTRELFEKPSRFILLHLLDSNTVETKPLALIAFSMFRFDNEKNAEGKLREVVYCYEVQISAAYRTPPQGLGTLFMQLLEVIGIIYEMERVMLTVFTANATALTFYEAMGYFNDEICPTMYEVEAGTVEADYQILSKPL
ncbi:MAG: hypothetical protein CYPHOPRED_004499 [Cyphobasidiales sp. Tagirdzhanova-0007]|nr:MAG: hypothetical protein CYPHOPRED_004499 [Cyphobasidiales sp. Tagirdzhanova-0007]